MDVGSKKEISCNVSVITEKIGKKTNYIARCEELGVSDFGYSVEESLENLKKALQLLIKNAPEKKDLLKKENPLLVTRIFL